MSSSNDNAPHLLFRCDDVWNMVDINNSRVTTRFRADLASLSPDGRFIAFVQNNFLNGTWDVSITSSTISHTARIYSDDITTIAFSPDSTRLLAMARDGQVHIWDFEALDSSRGNPIDIPSIVPSDRMIVQSYRDEMIFDGWFYGGNGARLLWLPHDMRKVLLATGIEDCRLKIQRGASNVAILDMKDYSKVPHVGPWWKGGIRFVDGTDEHWPEWSVSVYLARYSERLSATQKLTNLKAGQKRVREAYLEGVGQDISPRDEGAKRLCLSQDIDKAPDDM